MKQPHPEDASASAITIDEAPERSRFEISVDGVPAGFTTYADAVGPDAAGSAERTFPHTVIEEAFAGRGLATMLIRTALDAARVSDLAVIPQCSAVRHFIDTHRDYLDLVPPARRAELGL